MSQPRFVYKICPPNDPPPSLLPEKLPESTLDRNDGFIHLSTAAQIPLTARLFFADCESLFLLKIRTSQLDGRIEWTTDKFHGGVTDGCPHVHDSHKGLGRHNITEVIEVIRPAGTPWADVAALKTLEA